MLDACKGKTILVTAATAVLLVVSAYPTPASGAAAATQDNLAWVGCWELITSNAEAGAEQLEGQRRVCLVGDEDPNVLEFTSLVDGESVQQSRIITDGVLRPVQDGGCSGTESARRSRDGRRVFRRAEMACQGDNSRVTSGISLLKDADHWVDINVVGVGDRRELVIRRYRAAGADPDPEAGAADLATLRLAVHTARIDAAAQLTADDVIEALEHVDSAAVEAMLLEMRPEFPLDSQLLMQLAEAGVPGGIVDLMVALTFPDYFDIGDDSDPDADYERGQGVRPAPTVFYSSGYSYYSPWFAPFGYGYHHPQPPVTLVSGGRFGGRVVQGLGYTRVRAHNVPTGGVRSLFRGRGGKSSGGNTNVVGGSNNSSGGSGGGSSKTTTRKAKPRGGSS